MGEQTLVPPGHEGSTDRAAYGYMIGCLDQARLGAPRSRAEGVPLHQGILPSVNLPPRPPEEMRLRMPANGRSQL
jgi:hypothetical protein